MKRLILALCLLASCGASQRTLYDADNDYRASYSAPGTPPQAPYPAEPSVVAASQEAPEYAQRENRNQADSARGSEEWDGERGGAFAKTAGSTRSMPARTTPTGKPMSQAGENQPPADQVKKHDANNAPADPMVVYRGYLKLRVKRLLEAVDEIVRLTEQARGYIQSMTATVLVVRIPAADFDAVMKTFSEVGEVLSQRIQALDVTAQFTDLGGRLVVAREARARLLALLEQVKDVAERLRILQEIKRLTEQIESIESTLATLQNLVDYFTITLELVPVVADTQTELHRSPFAWVRTLAAHLQTLGEGKKDIRIDVPKGFVVFDKEREFRAQAADTTTLRAGRRANEPLGDNPFWADAVHHEMIGRDEESVAAGNAGRLAYHVYRSKDVRPRYYLVAVYAQGQQLYVVETFYPDEAAFKAHHDDVLHALETFQVP